MVPGTVSSQENMIAKYLKPDLLIIDDMGIKQLPKRSGEYLFEIVMRRYSTDQEHELNMNFKNLKAISSLKVFRTSSTENMEEIEEIGIVDNRASFIMVPQSIVTFSGKMAKI